MSLLFIPEKIKVGFQNRNGTYTGKLAYVIYYDKKGVLHKEGSFESWRDKAIEPLELSNEPLEGFVLNKKVGGYKSDWSFRQAYVRVFDPRGFEFEITVENLMFILAECDCSRGKGLEGSFVYSWDRDKLVLLPTNTASYKESSEHTTKTNNQKVKLRELVVGGKYMTKDQRTIIYIGRKDWYEKNVQKCHVFYDAELNSFNNKAKPVYRINDEVADVVEYAEKYYLSHTGSPFVKYEIVPNENAYYYFEEDGGKYKIYTVDNNNCYRHNGSYDNGRSYSSAKDYNYCFLNESDMNEYKRKYGSNYYAGFRFNQRTNYSILEKPPIKGNLYKVLESGSKFKVA